MLLKWSLKEHLPGRKDLRRKTATELHHAQRKIDLTDELVHTMVIEESQFKSHTRRLTDVALVLESQMEEKYKIVLEEKDKHIVALEKSLLHLRRERTSRSH